MAWDDAELHKVAYRTIGAGAGVIASLVMVAPEGTKNAVYRAMIGLVMGVIFAPTAQSLVFFLRGEGWEFHLAASAASGFTVWFVLEGLARFLSRKDTIQRLLEEVLRLSKGAGK